LSTPPDRPGGERSPIASTVPSPTETRSDEREPAVAPDPVTDERQKRLLSKAAYRARRSADNAFREGERC
jgi:hypothetical protein